MHKLYALGALVFLFGATLGGVGRETTDDTDGGENTILSLRSSTESFSQCAAAVEAARRRCAAMCGGSGYTFSPGACGIGASCRCGGTGGPGNPGPSPEEP